jgi:hypothetical protein
VPRCSVASPQRADERAHLAHRLHTRGESNVKVRRPLLSSSATCGRGRPLLGAGAAPPGGARPITVTTLTDSYTGQVVAFNDVVWFGEPDSGVAVVALTRHHGPPGAGGDVGRPPGRHGRGTGRGGRRPAAAGRGFSGRPPAPPAASTRPPRPSPRRPLDIRWSVKAERPARSGS